MNTLERLTGSNFEELVGRLEPDDVWPLVSPSPALFFNLGTNSSTMVKLGYYLEITDKDEVVRAYPSEIPLADRGPYKGWYSN